MATASRLTDTNLTFATPPTIFVDDPAAKVPAPIRGLLTFYCWPRLKLAGSMDYRGLVPIAIGLISALGPS